MTARRGLLAAILIYVTLDLSVAAMPGAFVFEPDDSVEAAHRGRVDTAADAVVLAPTPPELPILTPARRSPRMDVVPTSTPRPASAGRSLPRAALDAAPTSEDPH